MLLNNTLYSPSMRRNLVSVSQLESNGYDVLFGKGKFKIFLNARLVHTGIRHDGLYFLENIFDDNIDCLIGEHNSIVRNIDKRNTCSESYL